MECADCEILPAALPERVDLYITVPLDNSAAKLDRFLADAGFGFAKQDERAVRIDLDSRRHLAFATGAAGIFGAEELRAIRAVPLAPGAAATRLGDTRLFVNFNPSSIYDPAYCLRTTVSAV